MSGRWPIGLHFVCWIRVMLPQAPLSGEGMYRPAHLGGWVKSRNISQATKPPRDHVWLFERKVGGEEGQARDDIIRRAIPFNHEFNHHWIMS